MSVLTQSLSDSRVQHAVPGVFPLRWYDPKEGPVPRGTRVTHVWLSNDAPEFVPLGPPGIYAKVRREPLRGCLAMRHVTDRIQIGWSAVHSGLVPEHHAPEAYNRAFGREVAIRRALAGRLVVPDYSVSSPDRLMDVWWGGDRHPVTDQREWLAIPYWLRRPMVDFYLRVTDDINRRRPM